MLIDSLDRRRNIILNMMRNGKLSKEKYEEDLLYSVYEGTRLNMVSTIDVKTILKRSESVTWCGVALAVTAVCLSIMLR